MPRDACPGLSLGPLQARSRSIILLDQDVSERYSNVVDCASHTLLFSRKTLFRGRGRNVQALGRFPWESIVRVAHGAHAFGKPVRALRNTLGLSHNAAFLCDADGHASASTLVAFGGRDRTQVNEPEKGIRRAVMPLPLRLGHGEPSLPNLNSAWTATLDESVLLSGTHAGCNEARTFRHPVCEFDGRISVVRFKRSLLIFARENAAIIGGGRSVQMTRRGPDGASWEPFRRLVFEHGTVVSSHILPVTLNCHEQFPANFKKGGGACMWVHIWWNSHFKGRLVEDYHATSFGNWTLVELYFFVAQEYGDGEHLVGLFPGTYVEAPTWRREPSSRTLPLLGGIFITFSQDGAHWTEPRMLMKSAVSAEGRTTDHPVRFRNSADGASSFIHVEHEIELYEGNANGRQYTNRTTAPRHCEYEFSPRLQPAMTNHADAASPHRLTRGHARTRQTAQPPDASLPSELDGEAGS